MTSLTEGRIYSVEEDGAATNPRFFEQTHEWTQNCQRCVPAYEMRRRGYNVTAKPMPVQDLRKDVMAGHAWDVFQNAKLVAFKDQADIEQMMTGWGGRSQAEVLVVWEGGKIRPRVCRGTARGKTMFIDPQNRERRLQRIFLAVSRRQMGETRSSGGLTTCSRPR